MKNTYLPCLSGGCQTWMNPIKLSNSNHARVDLVVQLQSKYWNQHGRLLCGLNDTERPTYEGISGEPEIPFIKNKPRTEYLQKKKNDN